MSEPDAPQRDCLAALADIAARLASGEALEDAMTGILQVLQETLVAEECTLWLRSSGRLTSAWTTGAGLTTPEEIEQLADNEGADRGRLCSADLRAGPHRLGVLSARLTRPLSQTEQVVFAAVANLLAPVLVHAEKSHQLAVEVAVRTRQIEEQRRFTERIIDSLPVGLYVIDREYRIQAWNRKRETGMQGVSREEAVGRTIFEILHRQPAELLRSEFDDVFETGRIQQFQTESTATGDVRTFRISKIPMRVGDANVSHVITIGEDMTEWKEAQERFAQAEKLAAIGTLAAGVMHEINNPLATIAACAESLSLRMDDLSAAGVAVPPEAAEYLKIVDNEVQRCKTIVDGLLDFSRPKPVGKSIVGLNGVIEKTLFLLKHHSRFKKVTVQLELETTRPVDVHANPEQLIQVFMALLLNAMDAMQDRGTIILRTRRAEATGEMVVAEVIDRGHGIGRFDMPKIFEPFYTTKAPGRGTGLGLSICYGIVAEHGGRLEVESIPGAGSTFRIYLPFGEVAA